MHKVQIRNSNDPESNFSRIKVLLDGELIGEGHFGGEPEDNSGFRDYAWVGPLFIKLAEKLGATVSVETESYEDA